MSRIVPAVCDMCGATVGFFTDRKDRWGDWHKCTLCKQSTWVAEVNQ